MWQVFTKFRIENPFLKINDLLLKLKDEKFDWIVVDFHKEATSEWYWLAKFLDWKVSLVFWTHTHVQTNDEQISDKWTWLISDVWMNWAFDSIIWADFESVKNTFLTGVNVWRIKQSLDKNYIINWIYVEIWKDKKCEKIEKIRIRWKL